MVEIVVQQFVPKTSAKKLLKSKRNQSQNNPLEKNVKRVPAKSSTLFSGGLFWRQLRFGRNCSTLFSSGLFWRQLRFGGNHNKKIDTTTQLYRLRFGGNWLHIISRQIVFEGAHIKRELAPHYFLTDCFGGRSDLEGTGSTLFSNRLFWRQFKFGGKGLHIIFWQIVLEIWMELAPHYFLADCF